MLLTIASGLCSWSIGVYTLTSKILYKFLIYFIFEGLLYHKQTCTCADRSSIAIVAGHY